MRSEEFINKYKVVRKNTNCIKWEAIKNYNVDDLLPIWIADAEFKTAPEILNAMKNVADFGVFGYISNPINYIESFINWEKKYNYEVNSEWVRCSTGVLNLVIWALKALIKPQEEVLLLTPIYPPFRNCIEAAGGTIKCFCLTNNNGYYTIDFDALENYLKQNNIKAFIHCNPHNPVGRVWTMQEQNQLVALMEKYNIKIIADEIHQDLSFEKFIPTAIALDKRYSKRTITVSSNSKTYSIAGCSIAQAIIEDDELREKFDLIVSKVVQAPTPIMNFAASEAGYSGCEEWLEGFKDTIMINEKKLIAAFENTKVVISPLEGTYLAWMDFTRIVEPEKLKEKLIYEAKILPNFGETFGDETLGFIRLNLAVDCDTLDNAIKRLKSIL